MDTARWGDDPREELSASAGSVERDGAARRSLLRGLIWLGVVVLLFGLVRAGVGRAFVTGWWRQW